MEVSIKRHAPAALYPREMIPGTHCTGGWVDLRRSGHKRLEEKSSRLCRGSNLDRRVVQPVARHYTDWATQTHRLFHWLHYINRLSPVVTMLHIYTYMYVLYVCISFNNTKVCVSPTAYLCISYGCLNKQRLFPLTTKTIWLCNVFSVT
jgi:hypothetical protein